MQRQQQAYWKHSSAPALATWDKILFKLIFVLGSATSLAFAYFIFDACTVTSAWLAPLFYGALGYTILRMLLTLYSYANISDALPCPDPGKKSVAIFTTSYRGEPLTMVEQTLIACKHVRYPHTTYLLDNTGDTAFRNTAEKHGAVWLDMMGVEGAKAGKINTALARTNEEFILVLDPDHQPFPNFFDYTLGYFDDPEVGFVQVSQGYYNQYRSFTAKAAAEQTYLFYGPMQMAYSAMGSAIAIGANCTFRRSAFESIGGHVIGLAEDLQTSLRLHSAGWKSIYNPVIVNRGIVPEDFDAFAKQQLKWARGAMELLFNDLPKTWKKLDAKQKFTYSSISIFYIEGVVSFIFTLFPFIYFLSGVIPANIPLAQFGLFGIIFFILGVSSYSLANKYVCHPSERYVHWRASLLKFACWPIYLYAFVLTILRKRIPYLPTAKQVGIDWPILIRPHIALAMASLVVLAGSAFAKYYSGHFSTLYNSALLWWLMAFFGLLTCLLSIWATISFSPPKHLANAQDPWDEIAREKHIEIAKHNKHKKKQTTKNTL